ncbi:MAG: ribokinase, partial [Chloroflexi bacterium]|nr:ribokinase [Chloroflexota bacterium]
ETILGSDFVMVPGGKGANQAVAAARLGADVHMIGAVGTDAFGPQLRQSLAENGVKTHGVRQSDTASGVALITVDTHGENSIVVASGANMHLPADILDTLDAALNGATVLLLQLEIPMEYVITAAHLAKKRGVMVILDPAPAPTQPLPDALLRAVDVITPNESETYAVTGIQPSDVTHALRAAQWFHDQGVPTVVIKRGGHGVVWSNRTQTLDVPAFRVPVVDTVAAGDAFNGSLATALAEAQAWPDALRFAAVSAAIAVTRRGAQQSMASRAEVSQFLDTHS